MGLSVQITAKINFVQNIRLKRQVIKEEKNALFEIKVITG
jgi:hypothetical protein